MTTAQARAVPFVFANLRTAMMATASAGLLVALAPAANAACTGDGSPNTCTLVIGAAGANQEDINGVGTVDAGAGSDILAFSGVGMTLNANTIGTGDAFSGTLRFLDFEAAQVTAGTGLILTGTGTSTMSLTWTIDGVLETVGGNAIGDASAVTVGGTGILDMADSETIGSLAGSGSVLIASLTSILTAGGNGGSTTFSGILSGAGGFTKAGGGIMTLTGNNTYTGATTVAAGILEIGAGGDIAQSSSVTTNFGGQLTGRTAYTINGPVTNNGRITGDVTINGNVISNNGMLPGNTSIPAGSTAPNPGQDMGSILINGNYGTTAAGAYFGMFINIDAALAVVNPSSNGTPGATHDFVTIDNLLAGGPIGGTNRTRFEMASFIPTAAGGVTSGNGIQLLRITGANNGTEFYQHNAVLAGAHQYLVTYVANYAGADDGYFLQSAARDELHAHAALLSAGQSLIRGCFRDDQRIPDSPKGATYGRAWFGYRQGSNTFGADTGVEQDQDYSCTTGGMDWRMGHGWFGGVSGGFGSSDSDIAVPSGTGGIEGDGRVIEAYAAFTGSAFFLNLSAGYADMDWNYTSRFGTAAATSSGFIGSAQAGVGLGLEPLAVKLIGMISYDGTNCGEADCFGIAGTTEDTSLIEAKGALRFDGVTWGGSIRPWAQAAYSTVISDGVNTVSAGPYTIVSDTNDELISIDAGLQAYLDENLALYLDGGYNESLSKDISGYRAGIGAKLYW